MAGFTSGGACVYRVEASKRLPYREEPMKPTYGVCLIPLRLWMLLLLLCCACASGPEGTPSSQEAPSQESLGVRGARYCEVLLAYQEGLSSASMSTTRTC